MAKTFTKTSDNLGITGTLASYAATVDASSNSVLYRDAESLVSKSRGSDSDSGSGAATPVDATRSNLLIGDSNWSADGQNTQMSLLLFYNRALSSDEITALHNATRSPSTNTITVNSASNTTFSGTISETRAPIQIVKGGSGTLALSGNNTYTGQTNINAGIVSITNPNSLGTTAGATIIASGATLSISNDITSPENITINGTELVRMVQSETLQMIIH